MLCPVCQASQVIVEYQGVEVDLCPARHGLWLDAQELGQLLRRAGRPADVEGLLEELGPPARRRRGPRRPCPRCRRALRPVGAPGGVVVLDRCPRGHGLWFDPGELEAFLGGAASPGGAPTVLRDFLGAYAPGASPDAGSRPHPERPP